MKVPGLYDWFLTNYPELSNTALAGPLAFDTYEPLISTVKSASDLCENCTQPCQRKTKLIIDVQASRLYNKIVIGTEPCPRPIIKIGDILELTKTGFSPKFIENIINEIAELENNRKSEQNSLNLSEMSSQFPEVSSKPPLDITRNQAEYGGVVLLGLGDQGRSRELRKLITVLLTYRPTSSSLLFNLEVLANTHAGAHAREVINRRGLFDGSGGFHVHTSNLITAGQILGFGLCLHGLSVAILDPLHLSGGDDWEDSPLAQFLAAIENGVDAVVCVNYRLLQPSRSGLLLLAALTRFLSDNGTLWVLLDKEPVNLLQRDPIEVPVLQAILALPRFNLIAEAESGSG